MNRKRGILIGVIAAIGCLVLATKLWPDPPEVETSKAVRLGMTYEQIVDIMGYPQDQWPYGAGRSLLYGSGGITAAATFQFRKALGVTRADNSYFDCWPVHIRLGAGGRADRIKRGREAIIQSD